MFDILGTVLLGIGAGLITGLFPGIGAGSFLILSYTFLQHLSVLHIFIFYTVMMCSIPYYGSVSSIIYGVAGEITSTPAVQYGHPEFKNGRGAEILSAVATSSLVASIISMLIFLVALEYSAFMKYFLNNTPRLVLLTTIIGITVLTTKNKLHGFLLAAAGLIVGHIGFNPYTLEYFLSSPTFLATGVAFIPMFIGLAVMPELINNLISNHNIKNFDNDQFSLSNRIRYLFKTDSYPAMIRGGIIGSIAGLIPSVGVSVCSIIASSIEQKFSKNNFNLAVSAEAANNAAAITVLIPLVVLILPIIPSESIILGLAERKGLGITSGYEMLVNYAPTLLVVLLIVNIINWILSGVFYKNISKLYYNTHRFIYPILISLCAVIVAYTGYIDNSLLSYICSFAAFTVVGLLIKDSLLRMVFVFSFFLSNNLTTELYHFSLLNF